MAGWELVDIWSTAGRAGSADAPALFLPAHAVAEAQSQSAEGDVNFAEAIRHQRLMGGAAFVDDGCGCAIEHPDRPRQMLRIEAHAKLEVIAAVEGNVHVMWGHALTGGDAKPEGISVTLAFPERPRQDDDIPEIAFVGLLA